jgi:hypothetical protein
MCSVVRDDPIHYKSDSIDFFAIIVASLSSA